MEEKLKRIREDHVREVESLSHENEKEILQAVSTLEVEMATEHERNTKALVEEMVALESRHSAMKAELVADYEISVEEEKLSVYTKLRGECDAEVARIEEEIKKVQDSAASEISDMRTKFQQQKESLLFQKRQEFKSSSDTELEKLRSHVDQLEESFAVDVKALEDEHCLALQRVKAEISHKIEAKHASERSSLLATLRALKDSISKDLEAQKCLIESELKMDVAQVLENAHQNHDMEVEKINSRIVEKSRHHATVLREAELKHGNALANAYVVLESSIEADYMGEICRISGEIDDYKTMQHETRRSKDESRTNTVITADTETQTDGSAIELSDNILEENVMTVDPVEEDTRLPPNIAEAIIGEKLDSLRNELHVEHCNEIQAMKSLQECEMKELRAILEAQKDELVVEVRKLSSISLEQDRVNRSSASERHRMMEEEVNELKIELGAAKVAELRSEEEKRSILSALRLELHTMRSQFLEELEKRNAEAVQFKATINDLMERNASFSSRFVSERSMSERITSEIASSANIANDNSELQAEISRLEGLLHDKVVECEQLTSQVQSMFQLIDAYRGNYDVDGETHLAGLMRRGLKPTGGVHEYSNAIFTKKTSAGIKIDGVSYSSTQLMDALKKAVKQKNVSQKLCRQQQLCILALR